MRLFNGRIGNQTKPYKRDFEEGILVGISVRYDLDPDQIEIIDQGEDYPLVYARKWELLELSLVSIPEDSSCTKVRRKASSMPPETITKPEADRPHPIEVERQRITEIRALCRAHQFPSEQEDKWVESGASVEQIYKESLDLIGQRSTPVAKHAEPLDLDKNDLKNYSLHRALSYLRKVAIDGTRGLTQADRDSVGLELEVSAEIEKRCGRSIQTGLYLPVRDLAIQKSGQRAPYGVGTGPTGGFGVEDEVHGEDFITFLYNNSMVKRLGVKIMSGLQGNYIAPRQSN